MYFSTQKRRTIAFGLVLLAIVASAILLSLYTPAFILLMFISTVLYAMMVHKIFQERTQQPAPVRDRRTLYDRDYRSDSTVRIDEQ